MIEQPARARRIVRAEDILAIGEQAAKASQQFGAAFEADQRIISADLEASLQGGDRRVRQLRRIGATGIFCIAENTPLANIRGSRSPSPSERPIALPRHRDSASRRPHRHRAAR